MCAGAPDWWTRHDLADGTQVWDIANVQTRYGYFDAECSWSVNNYSNGLSPNPAPFMWMMPRSAGRALPALRRGQTRRQSILPRRGSNPAPRSQNLTVRAGGKGDGWLGLTSKTGLADGPTNGIPKRKTGMSAAVIRSAFVRK